MQTLTCFHPFTLEVMHVQLPETWRWQNFERYDGSSDLTTHNKAYLTQVNLFSIDFCLHCQLFPNTLKGIALKWYYLLPPLSIESFKTFYNMFKTRFVHCKPIVTDSTSLQNVIQGDTEPLRQYMTRFAKASMNISDLHHVVTMHSMNLGLQPGSFFDSLYTNCSTIMDALQERATRYINIEESSENELRLNCSSSSSPKLQEKAHKQV